MIEREIWVDCGGVLGGNEHLVRWENLVPRGSVEGGVVSALEVVGVIRWAGVRRKDVIVVGWVGGGGGVLGGVIKGFGVSLSR